MRTLMTGYDEVWECRTPLASDLVRDETVLCLNVGVGKIEDITEPIVVVKMKMKFNALWVCHTAYVSEIRKRVSNVLFEPLKKVFDECKYEGWDGYGGRGADEESYLLSLEFLNQLPKWVSPPDVSVDADGLFILEWVQSHQKRLSIIVGNDGSLVYTYRYDSEQSLGRIDMGGDIVSIFIIFLQKVGNEK